VEAVIYATESPSTASNGGYFQLGRMNLHQNVATEKQVVVAVAHHHHSTVLLDSVNSRCNRYQSFVNQSLCDPVRPVDTEYFIG